MTYKIWNITRNKSSCEIADIRESIKIALKKTHKKCTMWKEKMAGFADTKISAKRYDPPLQVSKNTKMEIHYAFFQWKSSMRYKIENCDMISFKC